MNDSKVGTIKGLLAKAESTTNPHEAEAFTAKAEKLMVQYGIEQAMLDAKRPEELRESITKDSIRFQTPYAVAFISGCHAFIDAFSDGAVRCFYSGRKANDRSLYLIGFESDVANLKMLLLSLQVQALAAMHDWWKHDADGKWCMSSYEKFLERRSFILRFFQGAGDRVKASRISATSEAEASAPGSELVLVDRKERVSQHMASLSLGKGRGMRTGGAAGARAGYAAGQQANVGGSSIGGGRREVGR